ncbi:acyl carrier protein [uncultured Piscinibacter sp.]|uniref:acyl carrier protein n=1 Tax=uncultured Piscinibacter sp. TaxID=1131835 RepID=UPI0026359A97|nr:acyl carrier protein [uncultured Piscinibacter sp.]
MTNDDIRSGVLASICRIAPEVEPGELQPDRPLRDQVDLDSMDWLNVIVGFHQRFGVDIPEADYAKLVTLDGIVAYLAQRLPAPPG